MTRLSLLQMGGIGLLIGLSIGFLFYLVGVLIGHGWAIGAYLAAAAAALLAVGISKRPAYRWNQENLRKGAYAEIHVGQIIEEVITNETCAIAHGVTRSEERGDIDHLVATPTGIWIVETKYRPVPQDKFSKVLRHIEESIDWVREWAPIETPVKGCLVLVKEWKQQRDYTSGDKKITAYTPEQFEEALKREARKKQSIDERVTAKIWDLGRSRTSLQTKLRKPKIRFFCF